MFSPAAASSLTAARPGYMLNLYPENLDRPEPGLEATVSRIASAVRRPRLTFRGFRRTAAAIVSAAERLRGLSDAERKAALLAVRQQLAQQGFAPSVTADALAHVYLAVETKYGFYVAL